jgi:hypothetical protein
MPKNVSKPKGLTSEVNLDGFQEFIEKNTPKVNPLESVELKNLPQGNIPSFERTGLKIVEPKGVSEIVELLSNYICDVEFIKVTPPRGTRVIRCTLNEKYLGRRLNGTGVFGNLIKIWDMDQQGWKSFYSNTVKKISYDENPKSID